jgi:hypothetical protein
MLNEERAPQLVAANAGATSISATQVVRTGLERKAENTHTAYDMSANCEPGRRFSGETAAISASKILR